MKEYDLTEIYYDNKSQTDRLIVDGMVELHATHIAHCITKTCLLYICEKSGIVIPFKADAIRRMELGKGVHKLYQQNIDWKLSELKDDVFGWYPDGEEKNFIEYSMEYPYNDSLKIVGTIDSIKEDSKGLFIEDIKSSWGYKYIDELKQDNAIQIHVYMYLLDKTGNPIDDRVIKRGKIKYVNVFSVMKVKIADVEYKKEYMEHIETQIKKFNNFLITGELPPPDKLLHWECRYCPFSSSNQLDYECPFKQ